MNALLIHACSPHIHLSWTVQSWIENLSRCMVLRTPQNFCLRVYQFTLAWCFLVKFGKKILHICLAVDYRLSYVVSGPPKPGGHSRNSSGSGLPAPPPSFGPQSSPHGTRLLGPPPPGVSLGPPLLGPPPPDGGPRPRQILPGTENACMTVYTECRNDCIY